ncbi:lumican [Microcaecilia unicolor]|uniref:Lumican n=1 Tax=Microcaecilia unicolor TaxID=1415580 RepID=A0A6P7Z2Y8_9AMPH|nr:lumican [Microcaecilia unicolor]XP_030071081.1 lumican [Microcaecilia unicolor]
MHLYYLPFFLVLISGILCTYDYYAQVYPPEDDYSYAHAFFSASTANCAPECNCPSNYPTAMYCNELKLKSIPFIPAGIKYLYLQNNQIESIEDNTFDNVTDLQWLILDRNRLSNAKIGKNAFSKLKQLIKLHISFNNLTEAVGPLPKTLTDLQLTHNQITKISPSLLDGLVNLTVVDLQYNALKDDSVSGVFKGLKSLEHLDLSFNELTKVPVGLPASLQILYLDNNKISSIPNDYFQGFQGLKYFRLSHNKLADAGVPGNLFNISSLLELDLSFNELNSIPTVNEGLENLYLQVNKIKKFTITSFCKIIGPLEYSRIKHLRLDGNNITQAEVPQEIHNCLRQASEIDLV